MRPRRTRAVPCYPINEVATCAKASGRPR